jgi:hypothetical protein
MKHQKLILGTLLVVGVSAVAYYLLKDEPTSSFVSSNSAKKVRGDIAIGGYTCMSGSRACTWYKSATGYRCNCDLRNA